MPHAHRQCCGVRGSKSCRIPNRKFICAAWPGVPTVLMRSIRSGRASGSGMVIEAVKIWNEPNNKSHWDPEIDPEWDLFAAMTTLAGQAIAAENPHILRVPVGRASGRERGCQEV